MAPSWVMLLSTIFIVLTPKTFAQSLFDDIFGEVDGPGSCENACDATFAQHTYEKAVSLGYCRRGCRLFTIINFVDAFRGLNQTKQACVQSCQEAYGENDNKDACVMGCAFQVPIAEKRQKQLRSMEPQIPVFGPMMYVHDWYSNMAEKMSNAMSISWSFYGHNENGNMLVVRSDPKVYITDEHGNWKEQDGADYKTSNYVETNLAGVDNSATPNLKMSQMHAMQRDLDDDYQGATTDTKQAADWLSCISTKTGIPRVLLTGTIFVSAFVMIWICLSSAVTAPDQRVAAQPQPKLSIFGDLEYLKEVGADKALLAAYSPQEFNKQAPPLPIKVKVQRI